MSADLIELHIVFDRPKSDEHMQRIAEHIAADLRVSLGARFARQKPSVYVADLRGPEDDEA